MALTQLTKVDGGGISTTSDYRVGIITASKFVGPFDGTGGNFSGVITATNGVFSGNISAVDGNFSGNVTIGGTLTYEDVTNIDSIGIITARSDLNVDGHTNLDNASIAGVTTFSNDVYFDGATADRDIIFDRSANTLQVKRNAILKIGQGSYSTDLYTDGVNTYFDHNQNSALFVKSNIFQVYGTGNGYDGTIFRCMNGKVELGYEVSNGGATTLNNLVTTPKGITVGTGVTIETNGQAEVAGITTFYKDVHIKSGTNRLYLGTSDRLSLIADPSHSYLRNAGSGSHFQIHSDNFSIRSHQGNGSITLFYSPITDGNEGGGPRLYHNHGAGIILERLRTTKSGVNITGVTTTTGLAVTGVSTFTGAIDANGDLDVDGHTNLDNVSIAGVTTISYSGTATYGLDVHNPTSGGSGARVRAGDNDSQYALLVENGSGTNLFEVLAGGGGARLRSGDLTILDKIGHYGDGNTFMRFPGPDQISFETAGDERLKIKSDGKVLITNTLGLGGATSNPGDLLHAQSPSGEGKIVVMGATTGTVAISGLNGTSRVLFGDSSTENAGNITYTHSSDTLSFRINGNTRWKFDSSGHFLPDAVGSYNIGSTGAEVGDVYIADSKKAYFGSDQDFHISHNGSHAIIKETTGRIYVLGDDIWFKNQADNESLARFMNGGEVFLYNNDNLRLTTTTTGITVGGEVAASQDYPNFRPTLDLNFAAVKKLDPRITYQRTGVASFIDKFGLVKIVGDNAPRFDHDPITRECKGLLIEESRTNIHPYSQDLSNWTVETGGSITANTHISPAGDLTADSINGTQSGSSAYRTFPLTSGSTYTFSFFMKYVSGNQNILISIGDAALTRSNTTFNTSTGALVSNSGGTATVNDVVAFPNGWYRYSITRTATSSSSGFIDFNHTSSTASVVAVWGAQVELGSFATSYILTEGTTNVTRGRDIVDIDGEDFTDFYNQTESTIISSHTLLQDVPNAENVYVYQIQDASTNNAIRVVDKNSSYSNVATGLVISGGSSVFHFNNTTDSFTKDKVLVALSVKNDDFAGCHNGGTISTDNSGTLPTNFNSLGIGRYPPSGGYELNGHIQRFIYYPKQLSDSQLKTLTA